MDVFSVLQPPHPRRFAFLSITFGLIANLDIGTEHLRCSGLLALTTAHCTPWPLPMRPCNSLLRNALSELVHASKGNMQCAAPGSCRFLGGARFTLGALHQILWQRTHHLRVAYLPAEDAATPAGSVVRAVGYAHHLRPESRTCPSRLQKVMFEGCPLRDA